MDAGGCVQVMLACWGIPTQWLLLLLVVDAGPPPKVKGKRVEGKRLRKNTEHGNSHYGKGVIDLIGKRRQHCPASLRSQENQRVGKYCAMNPHDPGLPWKSAEIILYDGSSLPTSHHVHLSKLKTREDDVISERSPSELTTLTHRPSH